MNYCVADISYSTDTYKICGSLKRFPFKDCNLKVDITNYYRLCVLDRCWNDGAECLQLAAYALECSKNGVVIEWRSPELCRKSALFFTSTVLRPVRMGLPFSQLQIQMSQSKQ